MRGKYYIIVLNKRLFKKSTAQMEVPFSNIPKPEPLVEDILLRLDGKAAHQLASKSNVLGDTINGNGGTFSSSNNAFSSTNHSHKEKSKRSGVINK
jgi:hypothetical protein